MSFADDIGYSAYDDDDFRPERIGTTKILKDNKIVDIEYCLACGSINIKTSKAGNKYCGDLCWTK